LHSVGNRRPFLAVVDDDPGVRKALTNLLRAAAFEVQTFDAGEAFLASLNDRRPDCVVLDLAMPGMSGFDVLSCLSADPADSIAIVAITARDSNRWCKRALARGASACLHGN
jgi:FixJ family two-component response regulator